MLSENASVNGPTLCAAVGALYAPPNVWPLVTFSRSPVKSEPSMEVVPVATYQLERPVSS
jgi:hypothetical protein